MLTTDYTGMMPNVNAIIYTDVDGVLCIEIAAGFGDAIKLRTPSNVAAFLGAVLAAANEHFGAGSVYISEGAPPYMDVANDLARKTLELPPDCGQLTLSDIAK